MDVGYFLVGETEGETLAVVTINGEAEIDAFARGLIDETGAPTVDAQGLKTGRSRPIYWNLDALQAAAAGILGVATDPVTGTACPTPEELETLDDLIRGVV